MSFHKLPAGLAKTWTLRDIATSSEPSEGRVIDSAYESPIQMLTLTAEFVSESAIRTTPYAVDDDGFQAEWESALEKWNQLLERFGEAIKEYNLSLIARSRELDLKSVRILGRANTVDITPKAETAPTIMTLDSSQGTFIAGNQNTVRNDNRTIRSSPNKYWIKKRPSW